LGFKDLDLLKGSQKLKIFTIDFPNGGFSIGKIKHHLKQTQEEVEEFWLQHHGVMDPLNTKDSWARGYLNL
jgi:hypothetical protein